MKQKAKDAIAVAKKQGFKPRFFKSTPSDDWIEWVQWNRESVCAIRFSDGTEWGETDWTTSRDVSSRASARGRSPGESSV